MTVATDFIREILDRRKFLSLVPIMETSFVKMIEQLSQFFQITGDKMRRFVFLRFQNNHREKHHFLATAQIRYLFQSCQCQGLALTVRAFLQIELMRAKVYCK